MVSCKPPPQKKNNPSFNWDLNFDDSWNHGQACCAGSRIFVQAGIYDEFLKRFSAKASSIKVGDPFGEGTDQGPQVSQIQYDVCSFLNFYLEFCLELIQTESTQ